MHKKIDSLLFWADEVYCYCDIDLNLVDINNAGKIKLGMSQTEILGKKLSTLCPEFNQLGLIEKISNVLKNGKPLVIHELACSVFGAKYINLKAFRMNEGLGMIISDVTDILTGSDFRVFQEVVAKGGIIKALPVPQGGSFSRKELDDMVDKAGIYGAKGLIWAKVSDKGWQSPVAKFLKPEEINSVNESLGLKDGDLVLIIADSPSVANESLGQLRLDLGQKLGLIDTSRYVLTWVIDFPLLEWSAEAKRWTAMHHPFTSPMDEDISLLDTDPGRVRAKAYDLVLNGLEIGGGSIRIHRQEIQSRMFELLGIGPEEAQRKFGFLLEALQFGAPPHGGIAFGMDRVAMILAGSRSIRDVIPFPKTQKATCLMTDAPSEADSAGLVELGLKVTVEKKLDK